MNNPKSTFVMYFPLDDMEFNDIQEFEYFYVEGAIFMKMDDEYAICQSSTVDYIKASEIFYFDKDLVVQSLFAYIVDDYFE